ncbi:MAG TPA: hypothetical protein VD967_01435 [Candidatus Paceibacterota bacterium]|nr:hypothetical protein [Candidatus Paceibacterota bacterium]
MPENPRIFHTESKGEEVLKPKADWKEDEKPRKKQTLRLGVKEENTERAIEEAKQAGLDEEARLKAKGSWREWDLADMNPEQAERIRRYEKDQEAVQANVLGNLKNPKISPGMAEKIRDEALEKLKEEYERDMRKMRRSKRSGIIPANGTIRVNKAQVSTRDFANLPEDKQMGAELIKAGNVYGAQKLREKIAGLRAEISKLERSKGKEAEIKVPQLENELRSVEDELRNLTKEGGEVPTSDKQVEKPAREREPRADIEKKSEKEPEEPAPPKNGRREKREAAPTDKKVSLTEKARVLSSTFLSDAERRKAEASARYGKILGATKVDFNFTLRDYLSELDANLEELKSLSTEAHRGTGGKDEEAIAKLVEKDREADDLIKEFFSEYKDDLRAKGISPEEIAKVFGETAPLSTDEETPPPTPPAVPKVVPPATKAPGGVPKDGEQPPMEEILASIRRIISEDGANGGSATGTTPATPAAPVRKGMPSINEMPDRTKGGGEPPKKAATPKVLDLENPDPKTPSEEAEEARQAYAQFLKTSLLIGKKERATENIYKRLRVTKEKVVQKAENDDQVQESRREYLDKVKAYIAQEEDRIRREGLAAGTKESVIREQQEARRQAISAETSAALYQARNDARRETFPAPVREKLARFSAAWAKFNKDHWYLKYATAGAGVLAGMGLAKAAGLGPKEITGLIIGVRLGMAAIGVYAGGKWAEKYTNKREAKMDAALEDERRDFEDATKAGDLEASAQALEALTKAESKYKGATTLRATLRAALTGAGFGFSSGIATMFLPPSGAGSASLIDGSYTKGSSLESTETPPRLQSGLPTHERVTPTITHDMPSFDSQWQGENRQGIVEARPGIVFETEAPSPQGRTTSPNAPGLAEQPNIPNYPDPAARTGVPPVVPPAEAAPAPAKPGAIFHEVKKGEGVLKSLSVEAKKLGLLENLSKEAQTNLIENLYAQRKGFTEAELKAIATQPDGRVADLNNLRPGDKLNLTRFFEDKNVVDKWLARAANLNPEDTARIRANNAIIAERVAEWQKTNPGQRIGDEVIQNMVKPKASVSGTEVAPSSDLPTRDVAPAPGVESPKAVSPEVLQAQVKNVVNEYLGSSSWFGFLNQDGNETHAWNTGKKCGAREVLAATPSQARAMDLNPGELGKLQRLERSLIAQCGFEPGPQEKVEQFVKRAVKATLTA